MDHALVGILAEFKTPYEKLPFVGASRGKATGAGSAITERTSSVKADENHVQGVDIWIEHDFFGSRHVVVRYDGCDGKPFTYCSFHHDHRYTTNMSVAAAAENVAVSLGATRPVRERLRPLPADIGDLSA